MGPVVPHRVVGGDESVPRAQVHLPPAVWRPAHKPVCMAAAQEHICWIGLQQVAALSNLQEQEMLRLLVCRLVSLYLCMAHD
jgi:hypothetical protein